MRIRIREVVVRRKYRRLREPAAYQIGAPHHVVLGELSERINEREACKEIPASTHAYAAPSAQGV
jgi:hypothetical protein